MSLPVFESIRDDLTTIIDWIRFAASAFADASLYYGHGTDNAWDDAAALVVDKLKLPHAYFTTYLSARLTIEERRQLYHAMEQRLTRRMPVPYLTHRAWFMDLPFYVDERVLIPRSPLAELIAKQLEPWVLPEKVTDILELCTGSGCIAVALAKAFPWAQISAVDLDADALAVAALNIETHEVSKEVTLYQGDLFEPLPPATQFQVIISNPPYVPEAEMASLPQEYQHEPKMALTAGLDGLDCVHTILQQASTYLTDDGVLIVEVGVAAEALAKAYPELPFTWLEFDHGGQGVFLLTAAELKAHIK